MKQAPSFSLYLRDDGSMLFVRGDQAIEAHLSPGQLLQLGVDCLQLATTLHPALMPAAAATLAEVQIPHELEPAALEALVTSAVVPSAQSSLQ